MKLPWLGSRSHEGVPPDDPAKRREELIAYRDQVRRQLEIMRNPSYYPAPDNSSLAGDLNAALVLIEHEIAEIDAESVGSHKGPGEEETKQ